MLRRAGTVVVSLVAPREIPKPCEPPLIAPNGKMLLPPGARITVVRGNLPWTGDNAIERIRARRAREAEGSAQ